MINERQIAELIFDKFRNVNCKSGHIVMMNTIRFTVIDKLNPKERELFDIVFCGLQITGYFTYEENSPECIRLTQKGYDYIYEDELISKMINTPWLIPSCYNPDWNKAYKKLWTIIGHQDTAICYIKGPDFYNLICKFSDELPPSYNKYIDELREKDRSTSRINYYKDLIDNLEDEQKILFYGELQTYIEKKIVYEQPKIIETDFQLEFDNQIAIPTNLIKESDEEVSINTTDENLNNEQHPIVFISYSWDDETHKEWVLKFATYLREKGIEAILDQWEIKLGEPLTHFMENAIRRSERVICVMTPNYKKKSDKLEGGVGAEYSIISANILTNIKTDKYIPLLRNGEQNAIPSFLAGRKYIDMRDDNCYNEKMEDLLRDIWEEPKCKKPPLGSKPKFE